MNVNKLAKWLLIVIWTCIAKWSYIDASQVYNYEIKGVSIYSLEAFRTHYEFDITKTLFCICIYILGLIGINKVFNK